MSVIILEELNKDFLMKYWYMLSMDEAWKHAKWKKPVTKEYILYDFAYT